MKTVINVQHIRGRNMPMLCITQGNLCVPIAVLNHPYSENLWGKVLNGHSSITLDCDFDILEALKNE